jgi:glucose-6-phosphate isomerase
MRKRRNPQPRSLPIKLVLLMGDEAGDTAVEEFHPGQVVYVTPRWAHRSINTGNEDLVTLFVYPAYAGHDYATIDITGFRKRILEFNGVATVVDNHTHAPLQRSDSG